MRSVKERSGQLFAEVPRPWGLAGVLTIAAWLVLSILFVTDAVPSASSEEWLYKVEANRAAWAERMSAREVKTPVQVSARRAPAALRASALAAGENEAGRTCN